MTEKRFRSDHNAELRKRAEERLKERDAERVQGPYSEVEMRRIIYELSVHQVELEMQKEALVDSASALIQSKEELQISLDRYADLYDHAPLGYLTLARNSKIIEVNLTAAKLLAVERFNFNYYLASVN